MTTAKHRHIIKRQVLKCRIADEEKRSLAEESLRKIFWKKLLPLINDMLDSVSPPNTILRIDQLHIELGSIPIEKLEQEVPKLFKKQFEKSIKESLRKQNNPKEKTIAHDSPGLKGQTKNKNLTENQPKPTEKNDQQASSIDPPGLKDQTKNKNLTENQSKFAEKNDQQAPSIPMKRSAVELLHYFLKTGRLPWWADATDPNVLIQAIDTVETLPPQHYSSLMRPYFLQQEKYGKRIFNHWQDRQLLILAQIFSPSDSKEVPKFIARWASIIQPLTTELKIAFTRLRLSSWEAIFYTLLNLPGNRLSPFVIWQNLQLQIEQQFSLKTKTLPETLKKMEQAAPLFPEGMPNDEEKERQLSSSAPTHNLQKQTENRSQIRPGRFNDSEEIYVQNAGLVLLWVFFKRLFSKLGYIQGKKFVNPILQQRAALLLQNLADYSTETPEYLLPLNKLLCGMDLSEPMEPQTLFDEDELAVSDILLEGVLEQAPGFGKISVEGLRKGFLQREGVIKRQEDYWLLQVQKETYDIVLNKLPWSYQIIRLPWMERPIFVEW